LPRRNASSDLGSIQASHSASVIVASNLPDQIHEPAPTFAAVAEHLAIVTAGLLQSLTKERHVPEAPASPRGDPLATPRRLLLLTNRGPTKRQVRYLGQTRVPLENAAQGNNLTVVWLVGRPAQELPVAVSIVRHDEDRTPIL
jgi:hypothetical protein